MKPLTAWFGLILVAATAFAGPEQIKQRAKELSNQNNVRQGIAPATPPKPAQPAPQATSPAVAAPAPVTPQQAAVKLKADLAKIKPGSQVTVPQRQELTRDLLGIVQAPTKPSSTSVAKLAADMAAALSQKAIGAADLDRLVQNLVAALGNATLPPSQLQAIGADVQAIFQNSGAARNAAVQIADDLKAVTSEIRSLAKS